MNLTEALNWRYAAKKYSGELVPEDKITKILEATALTASSIGIQPYRIFVINNTEIRQELGKDSFNSQIIEASHLIAFAAFDTVTKEHIDALIQLMAKERGILDSDLADFQSSIEGYLLARTPEENFIWSTKQAYIALGTALIAAADLKVDTTPMEGFDSERLDALLNLKEKGLKSVVLLALGYRDEKADYLANQKKVRLPLKEFVTVIN